MGNRLWMRLDDKDKQHSSPYWCSIWKFKWPVNQSLNADLLMLHVAFNCMRNQDISESSCETSMTTWFDWVTRTNEKADGDGRVDSRWFQGKPTEPSTFRSSERREKRKLSSARRASLTEWWNEVSMRRASRVSVGWSSRIEYSATTEKQDPKSTSVLPGSSMFGALTSQSRRLMACRMVMNWK